ncbi:MAG: hypothetical protein NBV60_11545 [Erythrobacter sp.]|nr:hypothetical protein [Erythrobacter sp.]
MNGNEFCSINIRRAYERDISCDIDDPRYARNGLKKEFQPEVPVENGVKQYQKIPPMWPQGMIWRDANGRQIPDVISQYYKSYSARLRDIVEQFQPGVLGWIPVTFTYSRGKRTEERFFIDNRSVPRVDLVDPVASNMVWFEDVRSMRPARDMARHGRPLPPHADPAQPSTLHFRCDAAVPYHMFGVNGLSFGANFISPQLRDAFVAAGLFGVEFSPVPFGKPASEAPSGALRPC